MEPERESSCVILMVFADYEITGGVGLSILGCCEGVRFGNCDGMGLKVVEMRRRARTGGQSCKTKRSLKTEASRAVACSNRRGMGAV